MGTANTVCQDWRWAQDTSSRNWIQDLHTNLASPASWLDTNIRLRVLIEDTGSKDETDGYVLQYTINGGTNWYNVTNATNYVRSSTSAFITDGNPTSQEIGAGTFDEGYYDTTGAIASYTLATGQQSEHEFNFQFRSVDVAGLTVGLRIAFDDGTALDGYTYSNPATTFPSGVFQQSHMRVRYNLDSLNTEASGWIGALDAAVEVDAEKIFRIRIEVEEINSLGKTATLKLQYRKNAGTWTDLTYQPFDYNATAVPDCHITATSLYVDGDATTNLLSGSSKTFVAGSGQEDNTLPSLTLNNQHTEYEFALVFHKYYDGGTCADGTTFEFRLVESSGTVLGGSYVIPVITMNHPAGLIGGCMVEAPGNIAPFRDGNGNLYFIGEVTHNTPYNVMHILKSGDGGDTWAEVDQVGAPTLDDLEVVDARLVGDVLHIMHHGGSAVVYHQFNVSTHSTNPDEWAVVDQSIISTITCYDQFGCMEVRDDGTVVAVYSRTNTTEKLYYKIRSSGGTWGSELDLDNTASTNFYGVQCIKDGNGVVHFFYIDATNRDLYHKTLSTGDTLSGRQAITTDLPNATTSNNALVPPVWWEDGSDQKVMIGYLKSDLQLYTKVLTNGTPGSEQLASDNDVIQDQATSRQPVAALINDGSTVYLLYGDSVDSDMYKDVNINVAGWGTDEEIKDAVNLDFVRGFVFTHSAGNGGAKVVGYIWQDGTYGGTGPIYYGEFELATGGVNVNLDALNLLASTKVSTIVPGAVSMALDLLSIQAMINQLSVSVDIEVLLDLLAIQGALLNSTVSGGPVSTALNLLATQIASKTLTIVPGEASIALDLLNIQSALNQLSVSTSTQVLLDLLALNSAILGSTITGGPVSTALNLLVAQVGHKILTVTPGTVSIGLDLLSMQLAVQALSVSTSVSILLDMLALQVSGQTLTVVPGAISKQLNLLSALMQAQQLTVSPGPVSIDLNTLSAQFFTETISASVPLSILLDILGLQASILGMSITGGPVSIGLDTLAMQAARKNISILTGTEILLGLLALQSALNNITILPGSVSTALNMLSAITGPNNITIAPGQVSIALDALFTQIASETVDISSSVQIALSTLAAMIGLGTTTISGGPVSIGLNTLGMQAYANVVSVLAGIVLNLNMLTLNGSVLPLSVVPGAVSTNLDLLSIISRSNTVSASAAVQILLNLLAINGNILQSSVLPGQVSVPLNSIYSVFSPGITSIVPGGVSVSLDMLKPAAMVNQSSILASVIVALSKIGLSSIANGLVVSPGGVELSMNLLGLQALTGNTNVLSGIYVALSTLAILGAARGIDISSYIMNLDVDLLNRVVTTLDIRDEQVNMVDIINTLVISMGILNAPRG